MHNIICMRKYINIIIVITTLINVACIRNEAPNAEADIIKCILPDEILTDKKIDYHKAIDSESNTYPLNIEVAYDTDLKNLAPVFELTEGATISPASGSMQDFSTPVEYTVTSESGKWHRTYTVNIHYHEDIPTKFSFENAKLQGHYYTIYENTDYGTQFEWASGNAGFAMAAQLQGINSPDEYPTVICEEGYIGNCLKLQTKLTGEWGARVGKPLAAGNLFMGVFHLPVAITNSLNATRFGEIFNHKPLRMTGYFKYQPADKYYDEGKYTDQKDQCSIYAMFFEKSDEVPFLDGTVPAQGFNHPAMVAMAQIDQNEIKADDGWQQFDIPFIYNKQIDEQKLAKGKYCIAVVFSSSSGGDEFKGAPGSTLLIDEVEIHYN